MTDAELRAYYESFFQHVDLREELTKLARQLMADNMVKGEFIELIKVTVGGEEQTLSLWRNPKTGHLMALDTLELPAENSFFHDPYDGQPIRMADTFTGLPK